MKLHEPHGRFPAHVAWVLVVAQPQVDRMAQLAIGGPLGEFDLRHELRRRPMWPFIRARPDAERAFVNFERREQLHQAGEYPLVESGPGMPDVHQRSGRRR